MIKFSTKRKNKEISFEAQDGIRRLLLSNNKFVFENEKNERIGDIYDWASDFSEGYAVVKNSGSYWYINKEGKSEFGEFMYATKFKDGKANVELYTNKSAVLYRSGKIELQSHISDNEQSL